MMAAALAAQELAGIPWFYLWCALIGAVLIQIATNFVNDAIDFRKGADTAERLGPLRVTQAGLLSASAVMRGAAVCLVGAALCGIPLIYRGGWPMLIVGLISMAMAYAYTGGPYPLAYHGLGELFVILFFGFIAVGGTFYVLTLHLTQSAMLAGFAAGSLATVLIVINNLRDIDGDRRSSKKTLAVRFGERFARAEVLAFALSPFVAIAVLAWIRSQRWLLVVFLAMPLAIALIVRAWRSGGAELNRCLGMAGALQGAFGLLFVIGCVLS